MADVTTGMWIGNKLVSNVYMGDIPSTTSVTLAKGPLSIEYIAVGGGRGGYYQQSVLDGAPGGTGGNWITSSLLLGVSDYLTIETGSGGIGGSYGGGSGTAGTATLIKNSGGSTIVTTATGVIGGTGGAGGINGSTNCGQGAPAGGIVWYDSNGYAGGGGGGACGTDAFCTSGGAGINGGGNGADTATVGVRGGGGGGGRGGNKSAASNGGPGIVTIRYFSGNQVLASGGTITSSSGYVYHTFNSNGSFTYS
jgi:hypothetical protein